MTLVAGIAIVGIWTGVALTAFALKNRSDAGVVTFFGIIAAAVTTAVIAMH